MALINKTEAKKCCENAKAKLFYDHMEFSKRSTFKSQVKQIMGWSDRQFQYRFMKGLGWTIGDAEKLEREFKLFKNQLWEEKEYAD